MPLASASAPSRVGRHGVALARFARAEERTYLADSYFRVPLQVMRPNYPEGETPAHLTLINPTGGHVGGDLLELEIALDEGARVLWTSQGATKVYKSLGEPVKSTTKIEMGKASGLELLPDPVIPYAGSIYAQETRISMAEGAKLLYGESLYHGRVASGEHFDYSSLKIRLHIDYGGAPLLRDVMEVRPGRFGTRAPRPVRAVSLSRFFLRRRRDGWGTEPYHRASRRPAGGIFRPGRRLHAILRPRRARPLARGFARSLAEDALRNLECRQKRALRPGGDAAQEVLGTPADVMVL